MEIPIARRTDHGLFNGYFRNRTLGQVGGFYPMGNDSA